mmetsp:Transcript_2927/g.8770  ORF Transcript_2927/g.8770 Transcript_2927/m.8770 type:complete len:244 (-) Transcript_2927:923-1654(-)
MTYEMASMAFMLAKSCTRALGCARRGLPQLASTTGGFSCARSVTWTYEILRTGSGVSVVHGCPARSPHLCHRRLLGLLLPSHPRPAQSRHRRWPSHHRRSRRRRHRQCHSSLGLQCFCRRHRFKMTCCSCRKVLHPRHQFRTLRRPSHHRKVSTGWLRSLHACAYRCSMSDFLVSDCLCPAYFRCCCHSVQRCLDCTSIGGSCGCLATWSRGGVVLVAEDGNRVECVGCRVTCTMYRTGYGDL